ncbi:N-myc-interactor [Clarias gariepinus]|uniref:N-myc-interactor n=1 Tax=Clarias gariepinus TaxID=13013 RepID=UPI00234D9B26|nr:N-myc-interactor [Clarias gariepinus]
MSGKELNGELSKEISDAMDELEKWKKLVEVADTEKSRLLLEKMDSDDKKKKAMQETTDLMHAEEQMAESFNKTKMNIQVEIDNMTRANQDLERTLESYKEQLRAKQAETDNLQRRFKIKAQIPEKRMKFTRVEQNEVDEHEDQEEADQEIKAVFTIIQRPSVLLKGGEALITFEEEKVADQILRLPKCTVTCDTTKSEVKPGTLNLEPSAKFEVHINVSKRTIEFSNADAFLSEERMKDRLELGFSKPSRGGGEVERIEYDMKTGAGRVTFLNTGVAENLALKGGFYMDCLNEMELSVAPVYDYQLKKFQTFLGVPKRTVLLRGIQNTSDEEDIQDHLEIHFQKPSNYGGEVESIKYVPHGKKMKAFFSEDCSEAEGQ